MKTKRLILPYLMTMLLCGCQSGPETTGRDLYTGEPSPAAVLDPADEGPLTISEAPTPTPEDIPTPTEEAGPAVKDPLTLLKDCAARGTALPDKLILPNGVELNDELLGNALLSSGNTARLKEVMLKAAKGEPVTLAYLGGSITAGSNASPMESLCWASLTTDWWRGTFPEAEIEYINAGIGATDSYVGVHRLKRDILDHDPDVVVVEFSVNDTTPLNTDTYESILRALLESSSSPAVVPLLLCSADHTFAYDHQPLATLYDLPVIAYYNLFDSGIISWEQAGDTDNVHPKNEGHALIAGLMCSFYGSVLDDLASEAEENGIEKVTKEVSEESASYELPEKYSLCSYTDAAFIFSDSPEAEPFIADGFVPSDKDTSVLKESGWTTKNAGSFSFEIEARTIGLAFEACDDPSGKDLVNYDVYVDGELYTDFDNSMDSRGNSQLRYVSVLSDDEASLHKVSLVPSADNKGKEFTILAWAVGR